MELVIPFTDESKSFAAGAEFGRLWQKISQGDDIAEQAGFPVRLCNKKVIEDACKYYGYIPSWGKTDGYWIEFVAVKRQSLLN